MGSMIPRCYCPGFFLFIGSDDHRQTPDNGKDVCREGKKEARTEQRLGDWLALGCWAVWLEGSLQKLVLKKGSILREGGSGLQPYK